MMPRGSPVQARGSRHRGRAVRPDHGYITCPSISGPRSRREHDQGPATHPDHRDQHAQPAAKFALNALKPMSVSSITGMTSGRRIARRRRSSCVGAPTRTRPAPTRSCRCKTTRQAVDRGPLRRDVSTTSARACRSLRRRTDQQRVIRPVTPRRHGSVSTPPSAAAGSCAGSCFVMRCRCRRTEVEGRLAARALPWLPSWTRSARSRTSSDSRPSIISARPEPRSQ